MCWNDFSTYNLFTGTLHLRPLRHAVICALDSVHNRAALDNNLFFIEIRPKTKSPITPAYHLKGNMSPSAVLPDNGRDEGDAWYNSCTTTHSDVARKARRRPILDSLKEANRHQKGLPGDCCSATQNPRISLTWSRSCYLFQLLNMFKKPTAASLAT